MSPEEEEGVATAEAPAEAQEPVPAPDEQEQADPKESADSGAQEPADEGSEEQPELSRAAQVRQLIKESVADDPELAAALKEDFGAETDDAEVVQLRQQVAQYQGDSASSQLRTTYNQSMATLARTGDGAARELGNAVTKAAEDGKDNLFDVGLAANAIKGSNQKAAGYGYVYAGGELRDVAFTAVARHPLAKHFTDDDYGRLIPTQGANGAATAAEVITSIVTVAMDVANRHSDPEGLLKKVTKEVEEKLGATDRVTKLAELLGNGASSKGSVSRKGGAGSSQPKDEQEAIDWHATGKWTNKQMRAWRQAQAVAAR